MNAESSALLLCLQRASSGLAGAERKGDGCSGLAPHVP